MQTRKLLLCTAAVLLCTIPQLFAKGRTDTEFAQDCFELAQGYAEVSKYDKAIEWFRKAAKDPDHTNAAEYQIARMYAMKEDWKKAAALLEPHYKKAPENTVIRTAFAYTLAAAGETERAVSMYKTIYENDRENPEAACNYIRIMIIAKKYDNAQTLLETVKTQFVENNEKKILDELEEKIKKARTEDAEKKEAEKKAAADTAASSKTKTGKTAPKSKKKPESASKK